jgi:SAM-dependent methyltransferase
MAMEKTDVWAAGDAYEPYIGRWSRPVARDFLRWLHIAANATWLDIGCGTGALSKTILDQAQPARVIGIDPSDGFVAYAKDRVRDARVEFRLGDAAKLPVDDRSVDAVVSGLVLNFVSDKPAAMREMTRAARPGSVVALYVWDYAGEMQLIRRFWDAAIALDPAAAGPLDEAKRFPICAPDALRTLFVETGLRDVEVLTIDVPTVFRDFEDYWTPFLGGQGPAPGYCMALTEEKRAALRERLRSTLPTQADGRIELIARAFAVRGTRPL